MKLSKTASVVVVFMSMMAISCGQVEKVSVVVTDCETGDALIDCKVRGGFVSYLGMNPGSITRHECVTDSKGSCTMVSVGNACSVTVSVMPSPDYYGASETFRFDEKLTRTERLNPIATPWNPTINLCLKKIRNPIPMYAMKLSHGRLPEDLRLAGIDREKNDFVETPAETLTVAWDLEKGDWVKPHGKGEIADFIFTIHRMERKKYISEYGGKHMTSGATVEISFSNQGDGLIPYPVPEKDRHRGPWMPYEAPEDGYGPIEPKINIENEGRENDKLNFVKDMNYFFRVRTVKDQTGKIISARYGKIHGDFIFGSWGDYIDYTYYLNPTPNDRDVEFKVGSNLFTDLKGTQDPYDP